MRLGFRTKGLTLVVVVAAVAISSAAHGQATTRAAFVANSGNLEGSVTAFRIEANGAPTFVNRIVTGTRTSTTQPCSGCNAATISITPNGKYVATGHAAGDAPLPDGITVFSVAADATIAQVHHLPFVSNASPLGVRWLDNAHLAVTRTSLSAGQNGLAVYYFDESIPSLTVIDSETISGFSSVLEVHPNRQFLFAQATGPSAVHVYRIESNHTLTFLNSYSTANYPLGLGVSPDGLRLYAASGGSGNVVNGWWIDPSSGTLTLMTGSPFAVPSSSPKQVVVSKGNNYAVAGYGGGGNYRNFSIDAVTGALTHLGQTYTAGITGSLGEVAVCDDLLLVPDRDTINDGVRGLLSYTIKPDGALELNGSIVSSQGITPNAVVGWVPRPLPPECPADLNDDNSVGVPDLLTIINAWGPCAGDCPPSCAADLNADCNVGVPDLLIIINAWGPCPQG